MAGLVPDKPLPPPLPNATRRVQLPDMRFGHLPELAFQLPSFTQHYREVEGRVLLQPPQQVQQDDGGAGAARLMRYKYYFLAHAGKVTGLLTVCQPATTPPVRGGTAWRQVRGWARASSMMAYILGPIVLMVWCSRTRC